MRTYRHIFFDLDRTLWDFEANARDTFREIFQKYDLVQQGVQSFEDFNRIYTKINTRLWDQYRMGEISKEFLSIQRFILTLDHFGIHSNGLAENIARDYVRLSPLKKKLFPHTHEVLAGLKQKYPLHLITNGFEEVQMTKIKTCDLGKYFRTVITSEEAGHKKPDTRIFEFALKKSAAKPDEGLMIGDDLKVDIEGARAVGMDGVWFNPQGIRQEHPAKFEIRSLKELSAILNNV